MPATTRTLGCHTILFADGRTARLPVHIYLGAAMVGEPTAYTEINGRVVWLEPGESVPFVQSHFSFVEA